MDIKSKAVQQTGRLHLRDANEELLYTEDGKEVAVNIYGPGSRQYAKAQAEQSKRARDMLFKKNKRDSSPEQVTEDNAAHLASITHSFENMEYDGRPVDGIEAFKAVYSDIAIGFIADQVARFSSDWSNFTKPSPKN